LKKFRITLELTREN